MIRRMEREEGGEETEVCSMVKGGSKLVCVCAKWRRNCQWVKTVGASQAMM